MYIYVVIYIIYTERCEIMQTSLRTLVSTKTYPPAPTTGHLPSKGASTQRQLRPKFAEGHRQPHMMLGPWWNLMAIPSDVY